MGSREGVNINREINFENIKKKKKTYFPRAILSEAPKQTIFEEWSITYTLHYRCLLNIE